MVKSACQLLARIGKIKFCNLWTNVRAVAGHGNLIKSNETIETVQKQSAQLKSA